MLAIHATALLPSCSADSKIALDHADGGSIDVARRWQRQAQSRGCSLELHDAEGSDLKTNNVPVKIECIRADRPDGKDSYLLYQHAINEGAASSVLGRWRSSDASVGLDYGGFARALRDGGVWRLLE